MNDESNIDAQALINKLIANNASDIAAKNSQIAMLEVQIENLKQQLNEAKNAAVAEKED